MKKFIGLFALLFCIHGLSAQTQPELTLEKGVLKSGDRVISIKEAVTMMEGQPEAQSYMKKAKSSAGAMQSFAFVGGAMIGYPVGTAIGGGEAEWGLAGIGAGLVLIAIPFSSAVKKKSNLAIDLYNKGRQEASFSRPRLNMGLLNNGLGIRLSF